MIDSVQEAKQILKIGTQKTISTLRLELVNRNLWIGTWHGKDILNKIDISLEPREIEVRLKPLREFGFTKNEIVKDVYQKALLPLLCPQEIVIHFCLQSEILSLSNHDIVVATRPIVLYGMPPFIYCIKKGNSNRRISAIDYSYARLSPDDLVIYSDSTQFL